MAERIPRDFIHQLLNRTDIVELIDNRLPLKKKSGNNYFACCPFHDEKSPSFSVSRAKQFYHCFGCGMHGNAIDFLMHYDRLSFPEAVESLAGICGVPLPRETTYADKPRIHPDHYLLLEKVSAFYKDTLRRTPAAIDYLKKRGLSGEIARTFELGFAPPGWEGLKAALGTTPDHCVQLQETGMLIRREDGHYHDRFRQRIMFPIHDRRARIVGFGGRIIDEGEPKYLNSPETPLFHKGRELYGLHHILKTHRAIPRIVIVEGYMDVIALHQHGIPGAVATLGTATTAAHIETLFRHSPEIIFCFDGDTAGRTAASRALVNTLPHMEDSRQIRFLFLEEGEDPDSRVRQSGSEDFLKQLANALPLSRFFFQFIASQSDLSTLDGRARFISLAMEHLQHVPEGVFKKMMLEELAKRARTDVSALSGKNTTAGRMHAGRMPRKAAPITPLRLVITLLIQHPALLKCIDPPLPTLNQPGGALLSRLLTVLAEKNNLTTGELLEYWRDDPEAPLLAKLATAQHSIPPQGIENEFRGALLRLRRLSQKEAINRLLNKAQQSALTEEEKETLSGLIAQSTDS